MNRSSEPRDYQQRHEQQAKQHSPAEPEAPQDLETEKALIGSVLLFPDALDEIGAMLAPNDLYLDQNKKIWDAIQWLYAGNKQIDPLLIVDQLKATARFEPEMYEHLNDCMAAVPHGALAAHYARIIAEKSQRRQLIAVATEAVRAAYVPTTEIDEAISDAGTALGKILEHKLGNETARIHDVLIDAVNRLSTGKGMGLMSGFPTFDQLTTGMQPANLIILAARPSVGKTALALNFGLKIASRGKPVGLLSIEQSKAEIADRLLAAEARMSLHVMRAGNLSEAQCDSLLTAASRLGDLPFWIDECLNTNIAAIEASARLSKRRDKIEFLIVDYLQLIKVGGKTHSREQEVAEVSRRLKGLAKTLSIPILCLAQLNREMERGAKPREPKISDLRESGSIEADADLILLMHRPDMDNPSGDQTETFVNLAKQRNGPTGQMKFRFDAPMMTFEDEGRREFDAGEHSKYSAYAQTAGGF